MSGFVYIWINKSNRKYYIGSHKGTTDDGYIGSGVVFRKAYDKNPHLFERTIIYQGNDYIKIEDSMLKFYDVRNDKKSYNMKSSAVGGPEKHRPESIAKRVANTDYKAIDHSFKKNNPNFACSHLHTPEFYKNRNNKAIQEKRKEKIQKPVNQYDLVGNLIKTWNSVKEASEALNIQVCHVLKGRQKTAGGFTFKYKYND
jgi:hypothetical protein